MMSGSATASSCFPASPSAPAPRSVRGAAVTKDVPPCTAAVGSRARVIRSCVPEAIRASLLRIAWWDWPRDKLAAAMDVIRHLSAQLFCARRDPGICHNQ